MGDMPFAIDSKLEAVILETVARARQKASRQAVKRNRQSLRCHEAARLIKGIVEDITQRSFSVHDGQVRYCRSFIAHLLATRYGEKTVYLLRAGITDDTYLHSWLESSDGLVVDYHPWMCLFDHSGKYWFPNMLLVGLKEEMNKAATYSSNAEIIPLWDNTIIRYVDTYWGSTLIKVNQEYF